jgi:hypothetical protein
MSSWPGLEKCYKAADKRPDEIARADEAVQRL